MDEATCSLHMALGSYEECLRGWCAFWHHGRCVFEGLGLNMTGDPAFAAYLLDVRRQLEAARDRSVREELLPPGLAGD
jgi:hypothetical protein